MIKLYFLGNHNLLSIKMLLMNYRCEDHVKSNQENQRDPGAWLNSKNNTFSDGIGRTNVQQEKIFMESSSGFHVEDFGHSVGDTYKIVESMTSSLSIMMLHKQDCKFSSVLNLAVYGIQCIKNRLTLMKTTLDPHSDRFQIVELRSASIPTTWAQRAGMIKVFEILVCLHVSRRCFSSCVCVFFFFYSLLGIG